jgi:predicted benzoate:H+ symporter BenE
MRWLPLPVVMGMFAGSMLTCIVRMTAAAEHLAIADTKVAAYLLERRQSLDFLRRCGAAA